MLNLPLQSYNPRPTPTGPFEERSPCSNSLHQELLQGYRPNIRKIGCGQEATATFCFKSRRKICYYAGKIHGGYQAFLLDQLFADCCKYSSAVTANLTVDFKRPIEPDTEVMLAAWPVKFEGPKIYMEGSIEVLEKRTNRMLLAARATALFIIPRLSDTEKETYWTKMSNGPGIKRIR